MYQCVYASGPGLIRFVPELFRCKQDYRFKCPTKVARLKKKWTEFSKIDFGRGGQERPKNLHDDCANSIARGKMKAAKK